MTTAASSGSADVVGLRDPDRQGAHASPTTSRPASRTAAYAYGYPAFLGVGLGDGTTVQGVYDGTPAADAGTRRRRHDHLGRRHRDRHRGPSCRPRSPAHSPGDDVRVTWTDSSGASHSATVTLAQGPVA